MLGYLLNSEPGKLVPPRSGRGDGWYDTGDIVSLDDEGFVTIRGRAKRFAKIGGEMISLSAVEELAAQTWPTAEHAVVAIPDPQKGEQLVLLTTHPDAARAQLLAHARDTGVGELNVPKKITAIDKMPLLATGKIDYTRVAALLSTGETS
jgi:acyl-[acyl-carrier-protein]-phospholipid O-acyltransferase/long-chain-fatty-acid--[acyl-carrier-protein] ligase